MVLDLKPQEGFQTKVANCSADVAIIGGAAGAGKTFSFVIEPLQYLECNGFNAVYFRRNQSTIKKGGGLLDETHKFYSKCGGVFTQQPMIWRFPSGAKIFLDGIEYLKDLENHQGGQYIIIFFDELTEFEEEMFFFMFSRNRGICIGKDEKGREYVVNPYIRASCNPKPDSWVARLVEWYIDQNTGYPIPERDGVLRYFLRYGGSVIWGDSKQEVIDKCPKAFESKAFIASGLEKEMMIKSFTFIAGTISENKILLQDNPNYLASLSSGSEADQLRFLEGNWKVASDSMQLFDHFALERFFITQMPEVSEPYSNRYITCDAAKFGQDLCVIYVWFGYTIVHTTIFHLSSTLEIYNEMELLRKIFCVPRANASVDQDGIGGQVVKRGGYVGFLARRQCAVDQDTKKPENYKQRKDQCYFHSAERFNDGETKMLYIHDSIKIFDKGDSKPRFNTKIKWKGEMVEVSTLIKNHLRAIKKGDSVLDGGELKYATNTKEDQKLILNGDSPDFADPIMMREDFSLTRRRSGRFLTY